MSPNAVKDPMIRFFPESFEGMPLHGVGASKDVHADGTVPFGGIASNPDFHVSQTRGCTGSLSVILPVLSASPRTPAFAGQFRAMKVLQEKSSKKSIGGTNCGEKPDTSTGKSTPAPSTTSLGATSETVGFL